VRIRFGCGLDSRIYGTLIKAVNKLLPVIPTFLERRHWPIVDFVDIGSVITVLDGVVHIYRPIWVKMWIRSPNTFNTALYLGHKWTYIYAVQFWQLRTQCTLSAAHHLQSRCLFYPHDEDKRFLRKFCRFSPNCTTSRPMRQSLKTLP